MDTNDELNFKTYDAFITLQIKSRDLLSSEEKEFINSLYESWCKTNFIIAIEIMKSKLK